MSSKICFLCKESEKPALKYGEFMQKNNLGVHYYCLLLSSSLAQKGEDDEGFLGFLISDIKKEAERVKSVKCCYCKKLSANIGCCDSRCRRNFHLACGIKNGAQNQFSDTFRSFCDRHIRKSLRLLTSYKKPIHQINCIICMENFSQSEKKTNHIRLPCCKNGSFHKYCMQEYADKAGYFVKCPLCNNNTDNFKTTLQLSGIFVPERDAEWELEPNAYLELLDRPRICTAANCLCPDGPEMNDSNDYEFIYCSTCGSVAQHIKCSLGENSFTCSECKKFLSIDNNQESHNNTQCESSDSGVSINNDDDEMIDVCSVNSSATLTAVEQLLLRQQSVVNGPVVDVDEYHSIVQQITFYNSIADY